MPELRREVVPPAAGERYPREIARTESGSWTIPPLALGAWTDRTAAPGETREHQQRTGGRITEHELWMDTIGAAQTAGWPPAPDQAAIIRRTGDHVSDYQRRGTGRLPAELAPYVQAVAVAAVEWLNANVAPAGRRFVLEDALYLIEAPGPSTP